jgi:hypothetical protein
VGHDRLRRKGEGGQEVAVTSQAPRRRQSLTSSGDWQAYRDLRCQTDWAVTDKKHQMQQRRRRQQQQPSAVTIAPARLGVAAAQLLVVGTRRLRLVAEDANARLAFGCCNCGPLFIAAMRGTASEGGQ